MLFELVRVTNRKTNEEELGIALSMKPTSHGRGIFLQNLRVPGNLCQKLLHRKGYEEFFRNYTMKRGRRIHNFSVKFEIQSVSRRTENPQCSAFSVQTCLSWTEAVRKNLKRAMFSAISAGMLNFCTQLEKDSILYRSLHNSRTKFTHRLQFVSSTLYSPQRTEIHLLGISNRYVFPAVSLEIQDLG